MHTELSEAFQGVMFADRKVLRSRFPQGTHLGEKIQFWDNPFDPMYTDSLNAIHSVTL